MKKVLILLVCLSVFTSCKTDKKVETDSGTENGATADKTAKQNDGLTLLQGQFIYYADAAVIQTPKEMFGVVINDKMHDLNAQVAPFKLEDTDMIPVVVRGKLSKKPEGEEGWDNRIEIVEILKVSKPNPNENDVIKLGTK
ncbi:hypothetical protein A9Q87_05835 [Flavobacteriales bacterium 34_180_T64]|nr:hypothetical protein A9Q87_05835 [Flavobacteriales bacterium 34_180_T64]